MTSLGKLPLQLILVFAVTLTAASALAAPGYSLSATPSLDVPDQTVTYESTEYSITSITRVFAGESVTTEANVPDDASYEIKFRGPDNQLISSDRYSGDTTHTVDYFGNGEAGTYAITIRDENELKAVYPVVLAGYSVSVAAPTSIESGQSLAVTANLTEKDIQTHSSLDRVEVVIGDDDIAARQQMNKEQAGQYTANISTADIEPASYNLYVVVRGDEDVRQRAEVLAVSDLSSLTISERSTSTVTETESDSGASGSGGGGDTGADDAEPTVTEETPTQTAEATAATRTAAGTRIPSETVTTESPTPTTQTERTNTTRTPTATTENSGVLTPETAAPDATTAESGPGFTILTGLLAVLVVVCYHRSVWQ
ncbi:hypothetical protein [Haloarcula sp. 1CSR25-25]|uniref:hypothetical protein n=1 Tax=Haloarcula sp. 1CSR25-25 TaxID=2862545 RepID=UPI002893C98D|nr:hypothetical protein [Haloarcula sp. 1CSR25-25]MDT3435583.1 hypothetical protein [Haloarcula sp. 1CSR25-25]